MLMTQELHSKVKWHLITHWHSQLIRQNTLHERVKFHSSQTQIPKAKSDTQVSPYSCKNGIVSKQFQKTFSYIGWSDQLKLRWIAMTNHQLVIMGTATSQNWSVHHPSLHFFRSPSLPMSLYSSSCSPFPILGPYSLEPAGMGECCMLLSSSSGSGLAAKWFR